MNTWGDWCNDMVGTVQGIVTAAVGMTIEGLRERTETSLYIFFFPPIPQWRSISDVLFTGGRGVSDFSVLTH